MKRIRDDSFRSPISGDLRTIRPLGYKWKFVLSSLARAAYRRHRLSSFCSVLILSFSMVLTVVWDLVGFDTSDDFKPSSASQEMGKSSSRALHNGPQYQILMRWWVFSHLCPFGLAHQCRGETLRRKPYELLPVCG